MYVAFSRLRARLNCHIGSALLTLQRSWCHHCAVMVFTTYVVMSTIEAFGTNLADILWENRRSPVEDHAMKD